jgi:hypothetical protein
MDGFHMVDGGKTSSLYVVASKTMATSALHIFINFAFIGFLRKKNLMR